MESSTILATASILSWYFTNVSTLILNKYIYQIMGFTYPFSLTVVHMVVCFLGSLLVLKVFPIINHQPVTLDFYLKKIVPLSFVFSLNIILGNVSLRYIPVSFMQTIKSSVPAFTIAFQFLNNTRHSTETYYSLIIIVGGVALASFTEVNFDMIGFVCAVVASVVTALFAIVTGMLLTQKINPISLLFYMSFPAALFLLPFAWGYEFPIIQETGILFEDSMMQILTISGIIALLLNLTSFFVIKHTSPLTFTVAGNFKVILSISISVLIFQNEITIINAMGCLAAVLGVMWYNRIKYNEANPPTQAKAREN